MKLILHLQFITYLTQKQYVVARTLLFFVRSNLPSVLEIASPPKSKARLATTFIIVKGKFYD